MTHERELMFLWIGGNGNQEKIDSVCKYNDDVLTKKLLINSIMWNQIFADSRNYFRLYPFMSMCDDVLWFNFFYTVVYLLLFLLWIKDDDIYV